MDKRVILERLKGLLNLQTDKALSDFLGINKATLSGWYARNTIDYDLVFEKCPQVSPSFLIYGEGEPLRGCCGNSITQHVNAPIVGNNSNVINASPTYYTQDIMLRNIPIIPYYCYSQPQLDVSQYIAENVGNIASMPPVRQFASYELYYIVNDDVLEPFALRGDVLALQEMPSVDRPLLSRLYVVSTATDGLIPAKVSNEGTDAVRLQAVNAAYNHNDLIVNREEVIKIYKVVGLLRTM